jgi:tRNA (uracil-5-)-methyltransferase TRM9
MDDESVAFLNTLNRTFYRTTAHAFSESRQYAWQGWATALAHVPTRDPLRVLDVGCGNGRFGAFMAKKTDRAITYHGIDADETLLAHAQHDLNAIAHLTPTFTRHDFIADGLPPADHPYDVIALFGVLHHVPSLARRLALIRDLSRQVAQGGIFAFSCWRFYEFPRFRERIQPLPEGITAEAGDYLLDWRRGANALRYCHYANDDEIAQFVEIAQREGLSEIAAFRADSTLNQMNAYRVLQHR